MSFDTKYKYGTNNTYKENINIYIYYGQDLSTVLKCCFLGSPFKIQLCEFFLIKWNFIF